MISLRKFIRSFTRLGDLKSAFGALQQMVALVGRGGFNISKTGKGKLRDSRLDIPMPFNGDMNWSDYGIKDETSVPSVYENYENAESQAGSTELYTTSNAKMKEVNSAGLHGPSKPVTKLLRWSFSDLIHACAKAKDCELAELLFLQMQNLGVDPSCGTYDGFIRALVGARGFRDGIQALFCSLLTQPKYLPGFIKKQMETGTSIVTGTRYVKGPGVHGWNLMRKLTSRGANVLAQSWVGIVLSLLCMYMGYRKF